MQVKALQYMYYDRREYQAGDTYEMDDREEATAKLLAVLGKIEIVKAAVTDVGTAPTYETAAVVAEEPAAVDDTPAPESGERKRYYRRRDMRAEK
jgi:hypothetical protein